MLKIIKGPLIGLVHLFYKASDIEKDFPITKPASEILVNENNSTFLNTHLINKFKSDPISNIDLI